MQTKRKITKQLLSLLICMAMLMSILPTGIASVYAVDSLATYELSSSALEFPAGSGNGCAHAKTEIISSPNVLGGNCTVKCNQCGSTVSFATSEGMTNFWNHDGSNRYSSPLRKSEFAVGESLYLWMQDNNQSLAPNEKIITIAGSEGATFTATWGLMGYFTFNKPGVYYVTIADKYNPLVYEEYTMKVIGSNDAGEPDDDGSCAHQYTEAITQPSCLVQGYTEYSCQKCGKYYLGNYTDPIGHSYTNYLSNGDGALTAVCDRCDSTDTVRDPNSSIVPSEETANQIMNSLRDEYPEGMPWTNDNYYGWNGGIFSGGYGCAGFCFLLSDAVFGNLPARRIEAPIQIDQLKVGDILRVNNDSHSVSVLEVHEGYIVLAEGNYNSSIHWGRKMTAAEIEENTDYLLTRYPENVHVHTYIDVVTAPTCTEQGYTTHTCDCGDSYVDSYTDALGHDYGEWYESKAPTVGEVGEERRDCSSCDAFELRELPALEAQGIPGDADGDGRVILKDAILLQMYVNKLDVVIDLTVCDVDGNGEIRLKDAILIQQYVNHLDVTLK